MVFRYLDKFQFVEQNSVECPCDLGANLVQIFVNQHQLFTTIFNFDKIKLHKIHDFTTIQNDTNATWKTPRDNPYYFKNIKNPETTTVSGFFFCSKINFGANLALFQRPDISNYRISQQQKLLSQMLHPYRNIIRCIGSTFQIFYSNQ